MPSFIRLSKKHLAHLKSNDSGEEAEEAFRSCRWFTFFIVGNRTTKIQILLVDTQQLLMAQ